MKTVRVVALVAIVSLLAACSGEEADPTSTTSAPAEDPVATTTTTASDDADGTTTTTAAADDGGEDTTTTAAPSADDATIIIMGFRFTGATSVPVGTTVRVTNEDTVSHTWTSDDGLFNSGTLTQGESFEFTFEENGEYTFNCGFHPGMTGSITVEG